MAITGTLRLAASKSSRPMLRPARRAIASTWITALVEQPIAIATLMVLWKAALGQDLVRRQVFPHHVDDAAAGGRRTCGCDWRRRRGSTRCRAGTCPSRRRAPSWSRRCPWSCTRRRSGRCRFRISPQSLSEILPARRSSQYFQASEPEPSVLAVPVAAQHRTGRHEDRRHAGADRAQDQAGRGLVAAAHQHDAVDRLRADQFLGLHGEEVAIEHRRRLDRALRQRDRRQFDGKAAGHQHAALHVLDAGLEVGMALGEVGPGIDDADDRLAFELVDRRSRSASCGCDGRTSADRRARTSGRCASCRRSSSGSS